MHHSHLHSSTTRPSFIEVAHRVVVDIVVSRGKMGEGGMAESKGVLEHVKIHVPIHLLSVSLAVRSFV